MLTSQDQQRKEPVIPMFQGQVEKITLPSSRVITIRESNGEDDSIMSNVAAEGGTNLINFLASVVMEDSIKKGKPLAVDIEDWLINDKYYSILKQRILNYGTELKFDHTCSNCKNTTKGYVEDLKKYDGDLSKSNYSPPTEDSVLPYELGNERAIELVTSSNKKVRYRRLNSILEKAALATKESNVNNALTARELELENQGKWEKVYHFGPFSAKEMRQIHSHVKKHDGSFDPRVRFNCGISTCNMYYDVSVLSIPAFFYPEDLT